MSHTTRSSRLHILQLDQTDNMTSSFRRLQEPISYHEHVEIGRRGDRNPDGKNKSGGITRTTSVMELKALP